MHSCSVYWVRLTFDASIACVVMRAQTGRIDDDEDETDDKQIFEIGNEQYGISTNQLEEKSLGCSALGSFVATMKQVCRAQVRSVSLDSFVARPGVLPVPETVRRNAGSSPQV